METIQLKDTTLLPNCGERGIGGVYIKKAEFYTMEVTTEPSFQGERVTEMEREWIRGLDSEQEEFVYEELCNEFTPPLVFVNFVPRRYGIMEVALGEYIYENFTSVDIHTECDNSSLLVFQPGNVPVSEVYEHTTWVYTDYGLECCGDNQEFMVWNKGVYKFEEV